MPREGPTPTRRCVWFSRAVGGLHQVLLGFGAGQDRVGHGLGGHAVLHGRSFQLISPEKRVNLVCVD